MQGEINTFTTGPHSDIQVQEHTFGDTFEEGDDGIYVQENVSLPIEQIPGRAKKCRNKKLNTKTVAINFFL